MSDKKHLLNESTIRRFMKLASIGGLSDGYVDKNKETIKEMGEGVYGRDPEEEELDLGDETEEAPMDDEFPPPEEAPGPEMDGPATEATVSELVDAIAAAITDATGIEVSTEESAEDLDDLAPDEELPVDDLAPEADLGAEEEVMQEEEEEEKAVDADALMEEMVARISKRVAARLLKDNAKE